MLENFNEDKRKNSMTQFSDFDSLLSLIFLRCSRTLRFHTGWSILRQHLNFPFPFFIGRVQWFINKFLMSYVRVSRSKNRFTQKKEPK